MAMISFDWFILTRNGYFLDFLIWNSYEISKSTKSCNGYFFFRGGGMYLNILRTRQSISKLGQDNFQKQEFFHVFSINMVRTCPYMFRRPYLFYRIVKMKKILILNGMSHMNVLTNICAILTLRKALFNSDVWLISL